MGQSVRGANVRQVVIDQRGGKSGAILWECKNTRNWSDGWIEKLKQVSDRGTLTSRCSCRQPCRRAAPGLRSSKASWSLISPVPPV